MHPHCLFYASLSGVQAVWRALTHFCITTAHCHEKPLLSNRRHSVGRSKDAFNVEHQFSGTDGFKRAFNHWFVVDIPQGATALHVQVFVSSQIPAEVDRDLYSVRTNTLSITK